MIQIAKPDIRRKEIELVTEVLKSGALTQGAYVSKFEEKFASFIGTKHGIACSSGTSALTTAVEAAGIGPGDEVITTPFTFIASSNAILYSRAKVVFADIDERTFNIDPVSIASKITDKTKAVLVVHLYGQPCRMNEIRKICDDNDLLLIEDCAQAHGAEYKGKKVGSIGDVSAFSFYATKNMVTGEGGMIMTGNDAIAEKSRVIINQGQVNRYDHIMVGYNNRMTNIEAAIGLGQFSRLRVMTAKRRENASYLSENLKGIEWLEVPFTEEGCSHVWHQYTVKVDGALRDGFFDYLNKNGVGARVYYPKPSYMQPAYQELGYREGLCPVSESVSKRVISLPVHPLLTKADLRKIVEVVKGFR